MRTVLEKISFRDVVNHCTDTAIDISVDSYVTIRNKGEKADILRGIRIGMALVKGNAHAQTDQYYRKDEFIDVFFKNKAWQKYHTFGSAHRPGTREYDQMHWLEEEGGQQTVRITLEKFQLHADERKQRVSFSNAEEKNDTPESIKEEINVSESEETDLIEQICALDQEIAQQLNDDRWKEKKYPNDLMMGMHMRRLIQLDKDFVFDTKDLPEVLKIYTSSHRNRCGLKTTEICRFSW